MTYTQGHTERFLAETRPKRHQRPADTVEAALHSRDLAYAVEEGQFGGRERYHLDLETIHTRKTSKAMSTVYTGRRNHPTR